MNENPEMINPEIVLETTQLLNMIRNKLEYLRSQHPELEEDLMYEIRHICMIETNLNTAKSYLR
jgi:hypothetical protein